MISRPTIVSSLATLPLQTAFQRPLMWGLVVLSLCAGLARLTRTELAPRLSTRIWGALPSYTLLVRGGDTCLRCPPGEGGGLGSGVRLDAPLDIVLRPTQPVAGPVFAHAFVRHAGHISQWPILMEHAAAGTLLLSGIARDLLDLSADARGPYELIFVVQRSPLPPSSTTVQAQLARAAVSTDSQLLHAEVQILAPLSTAP